MTAELPSGRLAAPGQTSDRLAQVVSGKAEGWSVIATLYHRSSQPTVVQAVSGSSIDAQAWERSDGWCDHCRTMRPRRVTYLLQHADGRLAQVGSTCAAEFLARTQPAPAPLLARRSDISSRRLLRRSATAGRSVQSAEIDTRGYLAHVARLVMDGGFVRANSESGERPPTWMEAAEQLERGRPPGGRAERRADDALAWIREELPRGDLDDFQHRLLRVLSQDHLARHELPTAAAGIYAYHQHLRRQIAARKKAGEHIAEPGRTASMTLTVEQVTRAATRNGPVHRHLLHDDLGRRAIWDSIDRPLEPGPHLVEITVAAHGELHGRPITHIKRCQPVP